MEPIKLTVLDDAAIRHIVREAEAGMADGVDPRMLLIQAVLDHVASGYVAVLDAAVERQREVARMAGQPEPIDFAFDGVPPFSLTDATGRDATLYRVAREMAAGLAPKGQAPMHTGKWLSKVGVVKKHIDAIGKAPAEPEAAAEPVADMPEITDPAMRQMLGLAPLPAAEDERPLPPLTRPEREAAEIEQPEITDPGLRQMLGLAPLPGAEAPVAGPFASTAPLAGAPAPTAPVHALNAEPSIGEIAEAYRLLRSTMDVDDADLAKRLGIAKGTLHNYLSGRTQKPKCDWQQARVLIAECDLRAANLRAAADIFSRIKAVV